MNKQGRVYRIYNQPKTSWIDVLRYTSMDITIGSNGGAGQQVIRLELDWDDGESEPARVYEEIEIPVPPDAEGKEVPPIKINSIKEIKMVVAGQEEIWTFNREDALKLRKIDPIRVYFNDGSKPSKSGMLWDKYKSRIKPDSEGGSIMDFAVVSAFRRKRGDQDINFEFRNEEIIDLFEKGSLEASFCLDPFQVIVGGYMASEPIIPVPTYILMTAYMTNEVNIDVLYFDGPKVPNEPKPPNVTVFGSYREGSVNTIADPNAVLPPQGVLYIAAMYDDDGKYMQLDDVAADYAWRREMQAKLDSSIEPPYPIVLSNSLGDYFLNEDLFGSIGPINLFTPYDGETPVENLLGDMASVTVYARKPTLNLWGIHATGEVKAWKIGASGVYGLGVVNYDAATALKILSSVDIDFSATFDGNPTEIIGYTAYSSDTRPTDTLYITVLVRVIYPENP